MSNQPDNNISTIFSKIEVLPSGCSLEIDEFLNFITEIIRILDYFDITFSLIMDQLKANIAKISTLSAAYPNCVTIEELIIQDELSLVSNHILEILVPIKKVLRLLQKFFQRFLQTEFIGENPSLLLNTIYRDIYYSNSFWLGYFLFKVRQQNIFPLILLLLI